MVGKGVFGARVVGTGVDIEARKPLLGTLFTGAAVAGGAKVEEVGAATEEGIKRSWEDDNEIDDAADKI